MMICAMFRIINHCDVFQTKQDEIQRRLEQLLTLPRVGQHDQVCGLQLEGPGAPGAAGGDHGRQVGGGEGQR